MTMIEAATEDFTFSRSFDAPRDLVWRAWSDPQALAQWWGPKGCVVRVVTHDFRPGGLFHYAMAFGGRDDMYGRFVFREIAAPQRISFVISFSDAAGGITRAPFPQLKNLWPLEVLNTVTFTEQGGKTTVALRGGPINATKEERAIFAENTASMQQGYGGSFEKLDAYLASEERS
jgi:uncharacterized protein YndB with AHSA1/START domain